jgi:hypothetical protein
MGVVDVARNNAIKFMTLFVILPPAILILSLLTVGMLLAEDIYTYFLKFMPIVIPPVIVFTSIKIWLWWTTYIAPLKKLSRIINMLKKAGLAINDSELSVISNEMVIVNISSCHEVPRDGVYTVVAISRGKWLELIGIVDERGRAYNLLTIPGELCKN